MRTEHIIDAVYNLVDACDHRDIDTINRLRRALVTANEELEATIDQQAAALAAAQRENARLKAGMVEVQRRIETFVSGKGATKSDLRQMYAHLSFALSGLLERKE